MKAGKTLMDLAAEVQRQQNSKKDYSVPVEEMEMNGVGNLAFGDHTNVPMTKHAHGQLGDYLKIPRKYYQRLQDEKATELLAENVNHWLEKSNTGRKMIRTLDGTCRAILSSRYRVLDNADMMEAVLPVLSTQEIKIVSCDITDKRLYLKALFPKIEGEIKEGDAVQSGIVISNSEIGTGGLKVQPLIYRLVCDNGMILPDSSINKYHVGRDQGITGNIQELLSDATKEQNDKAFWMSVRDVVRASYNEAFFQDQILKLREAAGIKIESKNYQKVVEIANKKLGFNDSMSGSVLEHLITGGDLSMWGLINAFTSEANNTEDYELATDLEKAGGEILTLSKRDWATISLAA